MVCGPVSGVNIVREVAQRSSPALRAVALQRLETDLRRHWELTGEGEAAGAAAEVVGLKPEGQTL